MILPPAGFKIGIAEKITIPGMCPYSFDQSGKFLVSTSMLENLERNGPVQKFYDAYLICDAVERPTVILEGLKRKNFEDALCYCSAPKVRWKSVTQTFKPPPLKVFCVYVNPAVDGLIVLDWDWRIRSVRETGIPNKWQRDFERIVWPAN